jgi:hypothetical protein
LFVGFYTGVGGNGGGAIDVTGCSGWVLIRKKAIAISNTAIQMRSRPMRIIVRTAPMSNSSAAVENKPTPVFAERLFSDRLAKKAAIIVKIHRTKNTKSSPSRNGKIALMDRFEVLGVNPERFVQSPFQPG